MDPSVRRYAPADLEICRRLWEELVRWHRDLYDDPTIGGDDPGRGFDAHLAEIGGEAIWVAEVEGEIVALAGMIARGRKVELEPVVVSPRHRRRGVGRRLLERLAQAAREQGARQVYVQPTGRNAEAIRFFHSLGLDVLTRVELTLDLTDEGRWRPGERIAGRKFRI